MPRPRNDNAIVDVNDIIGLDDIRDEWWTLFTLIPLLTKQNKCIQWLARRCLLHNSVNCNNCGNQATLNRYKQHVDGYRWMCNECNFTASVKAGSWFAKSHMSLQKLIQLTYFWAAEMPMHLATAELKISEHTAIDWFNFHRDLCCGWVDNHFTPIGGLDDNMQDKVVEIDETCFFRRKHHVGRVGPHQWVFGGVERGSHKCFLVPIADRTRQTLQPLIERYIAHGSQVMSDG